MTPTAKTLTREQIERVRAFAVPRDIIVEGVTVNTSIFYALCDLALAGLEAYRIWGGPVPPGHTDLMVTPESIDSFLEQNPLPPSPSPSVEEHCPVCAYPTDDNHGHELGAKFLAQKDATLTRLQAKLSQARTESIWRSWPDGPHGPRHYSDIDGVKGRDGAEIVTPFQVAELEAELSRKDDDIAAWRNAYRTLEHDLNITMNASTQREAALREALAEMIQQFKGQLRRDAWEFEIGFDAAKEAIAKARAALADRKDEST